MIQVVHYRSQCIGCNACVEADRHRWRMSRKDGKSVLIGGVQKKGVYQLKVENDEHERIKRAVKHCPVRIIKAEKLK